jgi:hypothetical protein
MPTSPHRIPYFHPSLLLPAVSRSNPRCPAAAHLRLLVVELNSAMAPWCIELDLELAALAETFVGEIPYREVKSIGVVVDGEDKNGRRCSSPRDDSL